MAGHSYDLTVVLPTKNEAKNLPRFLASLPPDLPLVVLDDSSDATPQLLLSLRSQNTQLVHLAAGVAAKRQRGAELADTEWLLFTDADVEFGPGYFEGLAKRLQGDIVGGPKLSTGGREGYYRLFSLGQSLAARCGLPAASASNMLVRRQALLCVGGFDPRLPCNEDTDLVLRLLRAGCRLTWAPDLVVYNTDQRRLLRGATWRFGHMLARALLLYLSCYCRAPRRWLYSDWGYWHH